MFPMQICLCDLYISAVHQMSVFKYLLLMVTNVKNTTSSGVKIDSHVALVDVLNVMSYRACLQLRH